MTTCGLCGEPGEHQACDELEVHDWNGSYGVPCPESCRACEDEAARDAELAELEA